MSFYEDAYFADSPTKEDMAKEEMIKRTANLFRIWQWRRLKTQIVVKWPRGWAVLHDDGQGGKVSTQSSDPNDFWREWLETNAGKQGWGWDWRYKVGSSVVTMGYEDQYNDKVEIRFRDPNMATMFALKYS
jgi:hypothetical protein